MFTERGLGLSRGLSMGFIGLIALVSIGLTGCASALYQSPGGVPAEIDDVEYLSSYGEWVHIQPFGMAWRPYVVSGWEPFYYGHWIWTGAGWTWTSYEPYGWLVFHYGFWGYQPGIGWFWTPGDIWHPARVQWYTFGNYTAWAPIPPPGIVWPDPWDPYDVDVWIVININDFTNENIGRHRIKRPVYRDVIRRQTIVKRAPEVRHVETLTKKKVPVVKVRKQPANVRTRAGSTPSPTVRRGETKLKRVVLPKAETSRVKKNARRVERKVITRSRRAPAQREKSRQEKAQEKKTQEKKTDNTKKKNK